MILGNNERVAAAAATAACSLDNATAAAAPAAAAAAAAATVIAGAVVIAYDVHRRLNVGDFDGAADHALNNVDSARLNDVTRRATVRPVSKLVKGDEMRLRK